MKHEDYIAAIKVQQKLIRKLFSSRKRRSEVIDDLTQERYKSLIGQFFRPQGDRFRNANNDVDYYIVAINTESNYVLSDTVYIELVCYYIMKTYQDCDEMKLIGIYRGCQSFRFTPEDNIDEILEPMFVDKIQAINTMDDYYKQMFDNFISIKEDGAQ